MPFVEVGMVILGICYLWGGKELFWPLGWYFGLPMERTWWRDVIYISLLGIGIVLWLPIVIIAVIVHLLD